MSRFILLLCRSLLPFAVLVAACGGGSQVGANASGSSSTNTSMASRATEPRTNDPTGATAAPMNPSAGVTANLGSSSPPAPSSTSTAGSSNEAPSPAASATASSAKTNADPPKKIGARHVLIQWMGSERAPASVVRSREQALAVAQLVLKRAKAGDDFARLAIEFSDEPGAGGRGGSLGRFGRGQMVPAFDEAVFKLEVGQISDIVESPFGYHVIQRTE